MRKNKYLKNTDTERKHTRRRFLTKSSSFFWTLDRNHQSIYNSSINHMETSVTMIPINREKQEIAIYQNEGAENNSHNRNTKNSESSNTNDKKGTPDKDS